jgi:hypothetical protein
MKRIYGTTLGILLSAIVAQDAAAQWNLAGFGEAPNRMYTTFGLDPAFVSTVGYGRVVPVGGRNVLVTGDVGAATANMDVRDFRARIGVQGSVARWRSVHLTGSFTAIARGTENSIYQGFGWGADITGGIGVYRPRWFTAAEYGKDKSIITHVTHSDWYREHYYPDAKDGWYLDAGGTYHYGVASGVSLGRTEVSGRFGLLRTEHGNTLMPPMYASVGVSLKY